MPSPSLGLTPISHSPYQPQLTYTQSKIINSLVMQVNEGKSFALAFAEALTTETQELNLFGQVAPVNLQMKQLIFNEFRKLLPNFTNFKDADLSGLNLSHQELWSVDLRGANLKGVDLTGTVLWGANLEGADLTQANLEGVVFTAAILDFNSMNQGTIEALYKYKDCIGLSNEVKLEITRRMNKLQMMAFLMGLHSSAEKKSSVHRAFDGSWWNERKVILTSSLF